MVTKEKQTEKALVPKAEKAVVTWQGRKITITFDDVKNRICPKATDQEVIVFLKMAQSLNLNPWAREIFLIKYKEDEPASYVVAAEAYLKAAELCPEFDGYEAGILIEVDDEVKPREGSFLLDREQNRLVGGYAKVYRKDRQRPFYIAVNIKECAKYTREGKLTRFWSTMPATMVRKVALGRALREAFPSRLGGMVTDAEYYEEVPENTLPPAFEKDGEKDWRKFWAKVKSELGLSTEDARMLLGVASIREELIDQGWTMEQIWDELVRCLREQQSPSTEDLKQVRDKVDEAIAQREVKPDEAWDELTREAEVVEAEVKKSKRDPETIRSIADLYRACHEDFKLQPKEVLKELGYSSQNDIAETPAECYRRIAAVRES